MLDIKKLKTIISDRLDNIDNRRYNVNEFDQGQACAYDSVLYLIADLEEEWEKNNLTR